MATSLRATKIDENNGEKIKKLQVKKHIPAPEVKRAALGELGNKQIIKNVEGQKEGSKEVVNHMMKLRNAKPRVDSHWKKLPEAVKSIKIQAGKNAPSSSSSSAAVTTAKISGATGAGSGALPRQTANEKAVNIEAKVSYKPLVKKTEDKPVAVAVPIRREDSNLSRKSLTKLKAALCNNNKKSKIRIEFGFDSVQSHSEILLSEVENIDAEDADNPILVSEYVNDIYNYLYEVEHELSIESNHLKIQKEITPRMRAVLVDWLNEVHYQFHLLAETYHMTIGIIDRYLQKAAVSRDQLQLVGVTALFIAAKYEELYPPEIADFVYITDDTYDKFQIQKMEKIIMRCLDFQMGRPLSIHFLRRFSKAAKATEYHHLYAKYFLELASVEYTLAHYKPSEIAAACLLLSIKLLKNLGDNDTETFWSPTMEFYSRYNEEHLMPVVKKMAQIVKNAPNVKLKSIYTKYQSPKFRSISSSAELNGSIIQELSAE